MGIMLILEKPDELRSNGNPHFTSPIPKSYYLTLTLTQTLKIMGTWGRTQSNEIG